ncbi:unnamed protein product [Candidula unifasciata]|uniref:Uncharacterized protein n=1 Tax=Candidula unifasciata TaxID=100452 RepID=A0A8S3YFI9_9EUPU|nr:unnamed protein product [Candidula unifasciata]
MGRTHLGYVCACACVFLQLLGKSREELVPEPSSEQSRQSSADVIMREDAEEMFYSIDLEKYDGVKCPDPIPPENGAIVGEGNKVGSVVYVECRLGYRLDGPAVLACVPTSDGAEWDSTDSRHCIELGDKDNHHETVTVKPGTEPGIQSSSHEQIPMPASIDPAQHLRLGANSHDHFINHDMEADSGSKNSIPLQCLDKPEEGPCRASFKRYYFSKTTMECHTFIYGGCHGNKNNFNTMTDCNLACLGHQ